MTVYRRPDPIPRRRLDQPRESVPLAAVRQDADDLSQIVARKIFAAIMAGHFPEGSILPNEAVLGESLGVSRTALREAIKGLSSKGMLETRRRRGTQVTDRDHWTMVDCEVISWTRKGADDSISEELWQGLSVVMPEIARLTASRPQAGQFGDALSRGATDVTLLASLLTDMARSCGNRFLASFASISLLSLARDDQFFLSRRLAEFPGDLVGRLAQVIGSGDGQGAVRTMTALFDRQSALATRSAREVAE